jgi:hypothetical protein
MIWQRPMTAIDFAIWMPICALAGLLAPGFAFFVLHYGG